MAIDPILPRWPGQLFPINGLKITGEAQAVFERLNLSPMTVIEPHFTGDYRHMDVDDRLTAHEAIEDEHPVVSWHKVPDGTVLWVITSGDRQKCRIMVGPSEEWESDGENDE